MNESTVMLVNVDDIVILGNPKNEMINIIKKINLVC